MKISSCLAASLLALGIGALAPDAAVAQQPLKIGLILPMTGQFAETGKQVQAAVNLYIAQHGDTVAGRKVEVLLRDDTGEPDITKRFAQQLVTNDHVDILAGFGLTPIAFAAAPVSVQAKVPMIVMAAGGTAVTAKSPYIIRTSFTLVQYTVPMANWEAKNGIKRALTLVTDYAPGIDCETAFTKTFKADGETIVGNVRMPLRNPDYSPFVQRAKDSHPDAVFAFVPAGQGAELMRQFNERGLKKDGIQLTGTGDVTDDAILNSMGDQALGMLTSFFYTAALTTPMNQAYVAAFEKANGGTRPNFMSLGGYDGMHLIYAIEKKTNGKAEGAQFVAAAKGMSWESPRGPMRIDPATREPIQNVYISKVQRVNGQLYNVPFETIHNVKADGTTTGK